MPSIAKWMETTQGLKLESGNLKIKAEITGGKITKMVIGLGEDSWWELPANIISTWKPEDVLEVIPFVEILADLIKPS
jgi:hypothetical protein